MHTLRHLLTAALCCLCLAAAAQERPKDEKAEQSIMNCAVMLGTTIDMFFKQQPIFDVRAYADTLFERLYTRPVEVSIGAKYMGKIYLQAFLALTEDSRVDYPDIERCLAMTGKHEAFYTLPFIVCSYYYSQWARQQQFDDKAIAAMQLGMKAHDKLYPDSTTFFSQAMNIGLSALFFDKKEWKQAAYYGQRMLDDCRRAGGEGSEDYYEMVDNLAFCLKMARSMAAADSCYVILQQYMEQQEATATDDYVSLLIDRAEAQTALGHDDAAESLLQKATQAVPDTADAHEQAMQQLVNLYNGQQRDADALKVLQRQIAIYEKTPPDNIQRLMPWIAFCDNPLSQGESQRLTALAKAMQDGTPTALAVLAYAYNHEGDYERGRQTAERMEKAYEALDTEEKQQMANCLQQLYISMNDFDRLIDIEQAQLEAMAKITGTDHDLYARTMALLGSIYSLKGDNRKAIQVLDSCTRIKGIEMETLTDVFSNMSDAYASVGDFASSNRLSDIVLQHADDPAMRHRASARVIVNTIAELEIRQLDADEQGRSHGDSLLTKLTEMATREVEYCRQNFGEGHFNTIDATQHLISAYYLAADTLRMLGTARDSERDIHTHMSNEKLRNACLHGLSIFYQEAGQYEKALQLMDTTCLSRPKAMTVEIRGTLEPLAELYLGMGHRSKAQQYFRRLADVIIKEAEGQMATLPAQARHHYWRLSRHSLANAGKFIELTGRPDAFAGTVYDMALFTKGLLLTSEQAFVRAVRSTNDDGLMEKLRLMMNLRTAILQDAGMTDKERQAKAAYANRLEEELLEACQPAREKAMASASVTWADVQQALPGDSSMAVELIQYQAADKTFHYGAVMVRKGWLAPVFAEVGPQTLLDKMTPQAATTEQGRLLWQYMQPHADGVSTLFISPAGIFHTLPFEDAPRPWQKELRIHRLSSTRQLATMKSSTDGKNAAIYGGLAYDATVIDMETDARRYPQRKRGGDNMAQTTLTRGNDDPLPFLPGTKTEADSITSIINATVTANMDTQTAPAKPYIGKDGTETSFKSLDGQRCRVIHIGTHGFYAEENKATRLSGLTQRLTNATDDEDEMLTHSGLYFAGALNKYDGKNIPDSIDDGILTAQETSALDLNGLELLTLSACQTAQGHVTADGVFGLQRGFKKAGAQSILMSLWKVDDEATCLLMTEFYRNWIARHMTKHDALQAAKQAVRSHKEKNWNDPQYWAAFILLDALD